MNQNKKGWKTFIQKKQNSYTEPSVSERVSSVWASEEISESWRETGLYGA